METRNKGKRGQILSEVSGKQKRSRTPVKPLPDDVVMDILSRLPANDVLKFRRVCRRWRDLISTQYFVEMHTKAQVYTSPMILVRDRVCYTNSDKLIVLDRWESPRKRPTIRKVCLNFLPSSSGYYLSDLSNDGLIVFNEIYSDPKLHVLSFIIFNPITGDKVTISCRCLRYNFYGLFFNPLIKEYCILLRSREGSGDVQFKMLNLGSQPCCRALKLPTSFIHCPRNHDIDERSHEPPVVIDDAILYWLVGYRIFRSGTSYGENPSCEELIMAFDLRKEEFNLMPHPGPIDDCNRTRHLNTQLLKMDGRLLFLHITVTTISVIINIWTLKDSATRLWIKSHSVIIHVDQLHVGIVRLRNQDFKVMAIGNGELLLRYSFPTTYRSGYPCRYYACKIEKGTARRIGRTYIHSCIPTYVPSFVSLRNCKSQISI